MNPDQKHPEYDEFSKVWKRCRDAATGQRAIHKGGEEYLPKLEGQSTDEYDKYRSRALYYNATGRTVEGMKGLVFRKKPVLVTPEMMKPWLEDITMTGISFNGLAKKNLEEVMKVGRYGLLVDYPLAPQLVEGASLTINDAAKMDIRPYIAGYTAENILNWILERVGSKTILTNVFLNEPVLNTAYKKQIRQLTLQNGYYQQFVWASGDKGSWELIQTVTPFMNGKALDWIPFWFSAAEESDGSVQNPPIEDMVYVNISHYQNSADLENGAHVSGLPTPYITGIDASDTPKLALGTGTSWQLPNVDSKVGFVHVGADGFATLEKLMDRKENMLAALGARMIAPEKKAAEAAETAGIRRGGENSVLGDIAGTVEMSLQQALAFMAEWGGAKGDVRFEINKDFLPMPMDAASLTAWVKAWQSGAVSEETFFEALQAGEVVGETLTFEDEQERKADSPPPLGTMTNDTE
ncbi:DUF4055 domain-containing protein [Dyadobacter jiangsuensis]|uniref:Uncharacterized protein DUF4055 n=1 Tax=Dyadobacter jiangsuensis TaxID=1591085 RepID=A0A2P8FP41_9BACT|nr:DUF4055 domain-containing protein [Dyadobacter jiangsuensis]PSL23467.1 uncharacterized protein DUF4055 [Dyadobacter jiangsuensis]